MLVTLIINTLILIISIFIITPIVINFYSRRFPPNLAPLSTPPDCSIPSSKTTIDPTQNVLPTGGVMRLPGITIPAKTTYTINRDFTLITDGDLIVNGTIEVNSSISVNITLVSLNGNVVIAKGALIGSTSGLTQPGLPKGVAATNTALYASAYGAAGINAGHIRLIAPKGAIDVAGIVGAYGGSDGGWATANGNSGLNGLIGGRALAVGGGGGTGGDVLLCAFEVINIDGIVEAGNSGQGGGADAIATNGSKAAAEGGPAGIGGNVRIHGTDPNCQVSIQGKLLGGAGDDGGMASAYGGSGNDEGGRAEAIGGAGNQGGSVFFTACQVANRGANATIDARFGGDGGDAAAFGGTGMPALLASGYQGGAALARGGDGGKPGDTPRIPMTDGTVQLGGVSFGSGSLFGGKGGDATASDGVGGTGGRLPIWGTGGNSGGELATGGTGKSGALATPATVAPVAGGAAPSGAGGAGPSSTSLGTP